jgi:hypothetical protein
MYFRIFAAGFLLGCTALGAAELKPVIADTPEKFASTVRELRVLMQPGGRYEFITTTDRARLDADIETMAGLLQKSGSVAAMSQADQIKLFNAQEHLNGILTHSDSERLVCEREATLGSNIPRTTCKTFGQIEKSRRDANKYLQNAAVTGNICARREVCGPEPNASGHRHK